MRLPTWISIVVAFISSGVVHTSRSSSELASDLVPTSSALSVCTSLVSLLPRSIVLLVTSPSYTSAATSAYNPLNAALSPACIIQPTTTAHLSTTMHVIHQHRVHYAVRAGGHSGMTGWDATERGVLIDLSKLTHFQYDPDGQTVTVGAGLRWSQIYELSEKFGVSPMGGRVGHVGTGLLLGGGLSLLSPMYGYACDGIVGVQVVTVQGYVRHIDARSHPSWLRAIKGGGGRFGIVTSYTLRAFPTGTRDEERWFGGSVTTLTRSGMDSMVLLTEEFVAEPHDDPRATMLSNVGMIKQNGVPFWCGTAFLFYQGTKAEFERVFARFMAIPEASIDIRTMSYIEASQTIPLGWAADQAYKWIGGSLYPHSHSYLSLWRNVSSFLAHHEATLDSAFLSITPVRTTQIKAGYAAGGNALSPPKGKPYAHWLCSQILAHGTNEFPNELDEDRLRLIEQNPSSAGLPLLLNEVDESQRVFGSYGWYRGLRELYTRVDLKGFAVRYQDGPAF